MMEREASNGPKLRPLFWTAVQQVPQDSVWAELEPPASFDQVLLEKRFVMAESRSLMQNTRKVTGAPDTPRKRLRVLDDKTSQMLAIAFNRLPPPERLITVVDSMEDFPSGLPAEALLALHTAVSEQKEAMEQLRHLDVPEAELASQLDLPERYLWIVGTKPAFAAKLACGALIVGPALELSDLRNSFQQVCRCCQEFRKSRLIRKCISTSLAVGNIMNRGTARSGARAIVLPDSLQKLDELRGAQDMEDSATDSRSPTLLDFVAQALVDEALARGQNWKDLVAEAEELRIFARAAQSVCLAEAEASCNKVCAAACRAKQSLAELPDSSSIKRLAERVRLICNEADMAAKLVESSKNELMLTQQWSSAKSNMKGNEWFAAWGQFLEQLSRALGRARLTATPTAIPVAEEVPALQKPTVMRQPLNIIADRNKETAAEAPKSEKASRPVPPLFLGGVTQERDQAPPKVAKPVPALFFGAEPQQEVAKAPVQRLSLFGAPKETRSAPLAEPVHAEKKGQVPPQVEPAKAAPERLMMGMHRPRPIVTDDDDVRMEDILPLMASKSAAEPVRQPPRPQTRVPCLYGFNDKENRF